MNEILLTVAIPTYNRAWILPRTLNSVINQLHPKHQVEIIVSDNASTDNTQEIVETYRRKCKDIQYYCNDSNIGADRNFLNCLRYARGKFVLLLGSDDIMLDGALEHICRFLRENPDITLLFLNHVFFKHSPDYGSNVYVKLSENIITQDKKVFMDIVRKQITFMSVNIISREAFLAIENADQYIGISFIHSCLFFSASSGNNAKLGVLASPCIGQDINPDNFSAVSLRVFGKNQHFLLCEVGPECGYDRKQLTRIFQQGSYRDWPRLLAGRKMMGEKHVDSDFWKYGYPYVKKYLSTYLLIIPSLIIQRSGWLFLRKLYRRVKRIVQAGKA